MNVSMTSPESLEQQGESNRARRGGEERTTGTNCTGHDNDNDNDNNNDNNDNDKNKNDDNARWLKFEERKKHSHWLKFEECRKYSLLEHNPNFPAEAVDGYMRAMYRDFIAQFPTESNDNDDSDNDDSDTSDSDDDDNDTSDSDDDDNDTSDSDNDDNDTRDSDDDDNGDRDSDSGDNGDRGAAYAFFDLRWGLNNYFKPWREEFDLLVEAIEARGEHLSNLTLLINGNDFYEWSPHDIQKFARFCARCPKVTSLTITEDTIVCEEAKYFFHEAVAAGNHCRWVRLELRYRAMDTWCDSFIAFLQSSSSLTTLRLSIVTGTDRASIQAMFLQGLARNTSLECLHLQAPRDWVTEPLQTMLILRRQKKGCCLPSLNFQTSQDYGHHGLELTPQMALVLMRGVCLGSVRRLQLWDIRISRSTVIQLNETLQELAVHPHFALNDLRMRNLRVYGNDRYDAFHDAIASLLNGVPGLVRVAFINCEDVPFAYCAGPSALRELTFTVGYTNHINSKSTIDFARFLEHLPSSSIRILNIDQDKEHMKCIQRNPHSLYNLEQIGLSCSDHNADQFGAVVFKIFVSSMRLVRISSTVIGTFGEYRREIPHLNEFMQLCYRNRCIQAFQSRAGSHRGLWPAAWAVLYRLEAEITTSFHCIEQQVNWENFLLSNVDIPIFNVVGSVIYSFVRQHACDLHAATIERGKRQASTMSIDATKSKYRN